MDSVDNILLGRSYYNQLTVSGFNDLHSVNELFFEGINRLVDVSAFKNLHYAIEI